MSLKFLRKINKFFHLPRRINRHLDEVTTQFKKLDLLLSSFGSFKEELSLYNKKVDYIESSIKRIKEDLSLVAFRNFIQNYDIEFDVNPDSKVIGDIKFVNRIFEYELSRKPEILKKILVTKNVNSLNLGENDEQGLPTNADFIASDHYRTMLKRYFYAGRIFATDKIVLDSCCGIGWGTYILSSYAQNVTAYDYDSHILESAKDIWGREKIDWVLDDALKLNKFTKKEQFDLITAMESIEHFSREEGEIYIRKHADLLKKGGYFLGTSFIPKSRDIADNHAVLIGNRFHQYLWSQDELVKELSKYYTDVKLIGTWMFIARK